jgi:hypothetical protein
VYVPGSVSALALARPLACWVFADQARVWRDRTPAAVARLVTEFDQGHSAHQAG